MRRCDQSAGMFKVSIRIANTTGSYHVGIGNHANVNAMVYDPNEKEKEIERYTVEEAPWVSPDKSYEGELCVHEVEWLNGVPGRDYKATYEFTVAKLPESK